MKPKSRSLKKTARSPRRSVPAKITGKPRPIPAQSEASVIEMVPLVLSMKSILVPIDFSSTSLKALRYAVPFATQFEAKITLVHVVGPATFPEEFGYLGVAEAELSKSALKRLKSLAKRLVPPELLAEVRVLVGIAFDTIVETARTQRTDLIIVTTHGHTGLRHVLVGSTAERIVRHAPCPVLVVREHEHEFV